MDAKHYTTDRLRGVFAIEKVFAPGEVNWTYTLFDRFLIGGAEPTTAPLKLTSIAPLYTDKPNDQEMAAQNATLVVKDVPVAYVPYFTYPDPTVKRRTGFLLPSYKSSQNKYKNRRRRLLSHPDCR